MSFSRILIIKPSSLGDIVHCLGVVPSLRQTMPNARISWLARPEFAPLLDCVRGIDQIILFDRKTLGRWYLPQGWKALRRLIQQLRAEKFDLVIDLQGLFRSALIGALTGCPSRLGFSNAREGAHFFYTLKAPIPTNALHMTDRCRAALNAIGIADFYPVCPITPPPQANHKIRALLREHRLEDFVVFIVGAAVPSKRWPVERFAALADRIYQTYHLTPVLVGAANEKPLAEIVAARCAGKIVNLCGLTSLPELAALLAAARLVVSNDTGPGQLAACLGTPTVMIFGPTNPAWVAPYEQKDGVVAIDPFSRPPSVRSAHPAHRIENIAPEMVWRVIERKLTAPRNTTQ